MLEEIESGEAQLFDVREQSEYDGGSIASSTLCPLSALKDGKPPATGQKTTLTYIHCQAGKRAKMAKPLLE
jgi:rhodanese-related sulfurtransferase